MLFPAFFASNVTFLFQAEFEALFSAYGSKSERSFIYLKSFYRARVTFNSEADAIQAKGDLQGHNFLGCELGIFFVQVIISHVCHT